MSQPVGYADDWLEIATAIKQAAGYRCSSCGLRCLSGSNSYRHLDLSLRRRLCAQVHHIDGNPSHNDKSNLVCLCSGCHLRMHRHRPTPTLGQLALKLKLPKSRRLPTFLVRLERSRGCYFSRFQSRHRRADKHRPTQDCHFDKLYSNTLGVKTRSAQKLSPV